MADRTEQQLQACCAIVVVLEILCALQVVTNMAVVHAGLPLNGVSIQLLGWLIHFNSRPWLCRGGNFGSRMLVVGLWLGAEEVEQIVAERLNAPSDLAG